MMIKQKITSYGPGLIAVVAVSGVAVLLKNIVLGKIIPVSELFYAIVIGLIISNAIGIPKRCKPGVGLAVKKLLRWGIILMGIKLSFSELAKGGLQSLLVVFPCIILAMVLVYFIAKKIGMQEELAILIGVGTSICGNSAIIATAPAIEAEDDQVAFAVATITLFGTICVFAYPFIGHFFNMSDKFFGLWSGTAINDTSQVVAASGIYSEAAQKIATVTKLTRNLFMAPVILILSALHMRKASDNKNNKRSYKKVFPWFVAGFVIFAIIRTAGDSMIDHQVMSYVVESCKLISKYLIMLAIAGVGLSTNFSSIKRIGIRPFIAGFIASLIMAGVSMLLITVLGLAQ